MAFFIKSGFVKTEKKACLSKLLRHSSKGFRKPLNDFNLCSGDDDEIQYLLRTTKS
jgi:hypothetical protein